VWLHSGGATEIGWPMCGRRVTGSYGRSNNREGTRLKETIIMSPGRPSRRKRRKIYGGKPGRKLMFLARPFDTYLDVVKSMVCTGTLTEGFWPP
jgi:hypothetical protein